MNHLQIRQQARQAIEVYAARAAEGERRAQQGEFIPFSRLERTQTLLHRWERMVETYGDKPALEEEARTLSYAATNALTNRIAHAILAHDLPRDVPVALLFEIEGDMPLGVLATWKAGHFFAWFEPRQPLARNQTIRDDCGATVVVTNHKHATLARQLWPTPGAVIIIEELDEALPRTNPPILLTATDPAYVIYTSGSTGMPKGSVELHGNLVHLMAVRESLFHFGPQDRVSFLLYGVGINFALAAAWMYGGCFLPFDARNEGLTRFSHWLIARRITFVVGGADVRTWLLTLDGREQFPDLRFLLLSTGPSYREHLLAYQRYLPDSCLLANLYSATEFRIGGFYLMDKHTMVANRLLPAGYAAPTVVIEVWDDAGHVVPTDVAGEIVVISDHLTAGYWRAPELNEAKYGIDAEGRRYFRTGDLGRVDADGCLWTLGRKDGFVKIRGNRVETAEVEVALREVPGVLEAAVLAQGDSDETRFLVGFVAMQNARAGQEIRQQVAAFVPDYMIPAEITVLEELPRNANGKVDRTALPGMGGATVAQTDGLSTHSDHPNGDHSTGDHPTGEYWPLTRSDAERSPLERWEWIVARCGEHPAIEEDGRVYSYRELNARMNRLAHAILAHKSPADVPVAMMFDIEADLATSIFAIWKAGNFFVWLEPQQPQARHQLILEDAGAPLIITNQKHAAQAQQLFPADRIIVLEELLEETVDARAQDGFGSDNLSGDNLSSANPPITIHADSPAYLIYTSGSTGKPKGVLEVQRNLMLMFLVRQEFMHFSNRDRVGLLVAGSGWSFATLGALLYGGCLLPYRVREAGLVRFGKWLRDQCITVAIGGAVLRTWLLTLDGSQQYPALRFFTLGAGPSYREHIDAYQRYLPASCRMLNTYSATEVRSITVMMMDKASHIQTRLLPAGYATLDSRVEIWDNDDQRMATGETGEIIVITPYTALGYWQSPELTAARFGTDAQGRRFYRTGDLGKLDEAGCLWVLGRKEGFIKIRGNRVETAEVEVSLLELDGVREAAVIQRGDTDEERELLAFIAATPALDGAAVRHQLATRLPDYMVPSLVVVLEELPRNANGKVARPLLRDMAQAFRAATYPPQSPAPLASTHMGETQQRVAAMARDLLDGRALGLHDNFFDYGGHSLLVARLMLQIYRTFGVDLAPRDFYADPTIAGLAVRVDDAQSTHLPTGTPATPGSSLPVASTRVAPGGMEAVDVLPGDPKNFPVFLCLGWNGAEEMLPRYHELIRRIDRQWPLYGLVASGTADPAAQFTTMPELVDAALAAMRAVQPHGPYLLIGECLGGKLAYEIARALEQDGEPIGLLMMLDAPFRPKWAADRLVDRVTPRARSWVYQLGERIDHHRQRLQGRGLKEGVHYVAERLGALLPRAMMPESSFRPRLIAHRRYADLLVNYAAQATYDQPVKMLFTRDHKHHEPQWAALIADREVVDVDSAHQDYLRETGDQVATFVNNTLAAIQWNEGAQKFQA